MNVTTMRHPMRHICAPVDQTDTEIYMYHYILLNTTIQSRSAKNGCFK